MDANFRGMVVLIETAECPACGNLMPKILADRVTHNPGNCAEYRATHDGAYECACIDTAHHSFVRYLMTMEGVDLPGGTRIMDADVHIVHHETN